MKKNSIEYLIEETSPNLPIMDEAKERYNKEISQTFRLGAVFGIICLFALIGIISLFSSCQKCVQCETTTTTIDLENVPQGETKESFPVCNRTEIKYWNGRKTLESKGGYKILTYTNCDE